jgi:hypothetical protein
VKGREGKGREGKRKEAREEEGKGSQGREEKGKRNEPESDGYRIVTCSSVAWRQEFLRHTNGINRAITGII